MHAKNKEKSVVLWWAWGVLFIFKNKNNLKATIHVLFVLNLKLELILYQAL
jgi:hypothetical protein